MHFIGLIGILLALSCTGIVMVAALDAGEVAALTDMQIEWGSQLGWTGSPSCNWNLVKCNSNGHVSQLLLSSNQLTGTIPESIGNLPALQSLDLSINQLPIMTWPIIHFLESFQSVYARVQRQFDCSKFAGPNTHYTCPLPCCTNVLTCTNSSTPVLGCQSDQYRKDCGFSGVTQEQCESKACCWSPVNSPFCFFKTNSSSPIY